MALLASNLVKGGGVAVGSNDTLTMKVEGESSSFQRTIVAETVSPSSASGKTELMRGDGQYYAVYFTSHMRSLSIDFYILGTNPTTASGLYSDGSSPLITPGDKITFIFTQDTFTDLVGTWFADSFTSIRTFGEVRRCNLTCTRYPLIQ